MVQTRLEGTGISETRLMVEVWQAVKDFPFVFTYDHERLRQAAPGVATLSGPEVYFGYGGGAAVGAGPGVALGAALALKGSGKLPVAVLGDGEMLASVQALWTAAHHRIARTVGGRQQPLPIPMMRCISVALPWSAIDRWRTAALPYASRTRSPTSLLWHAAAASTVLARSRTRSKLPSTLAQAAERVARGETVLIDVWTDALG